THDRRTLGLASRVRRAARSDVADPRLLRLRRQGCARRAEADFAEGLWHPAARSRQPLVHVLLLHHLRRLVGLANALPLYFSVQYHVSGVAAGLLVSLIVAF